MAKLHFRSPPWSQSPPLSFHWLRLPSSLQLRPQTVTSREPHLIPASRPHQAGPAPAGLSCLSMVPLLVGPSHESMEGSPLTVAAPRSFQSGSVRGGVVFSCSLWRLLGYKSPSFLGDAC